jgi:hypothetical protein
MFYTEDAFQKLFIYLRYVCVFHMHYSNLKSWAPSKYFAMVDLQRICRSKLVCVLIIDLSAHLSPHLELE